MCGVHVLERGGGSALLHLPRHTSAYENRQVAGRPLVGVCAVLVVAPPAGCFSCHLAVVAYNTGFCMAAVTSSGRKTAFTPQSASGNVLKLPMIITGRVRCVTRVSRAYLRDVSAISAVSGYRAPEPVLSERNVTETQGKRKRSIVLLCAYALR